MTHIHRPIYLSTDIHWVWVSKHGNVKIVLQSTVLLCFMGILLNNNHYLGLQVNVQHIKIAKCFAAV